MLRVASSIPSVTIKITLKVGMGWCYAWYMPEGDDGWFLTLFFKNCTNLFFVIIFWIIIYWNVLFLLVFFQMKFSKIHVKKIDTKINRDYNQIFVHNFDYFSKSNRIDYKSCEDVFCFRNNFSLLFLNVMEILFWDKKYI